MLYNHKKAIYFFTLNKMSLSFYSQLKGKWIVIMKIKLHTKVQHKKARKLHQKPSTSPKTTHKVNEVDWEMLPSEALKINYVN